MRNLWRIWNEKLEAVNKPFQGFLTTSVFHLIITCVFVFFYAN
jgi:hypothetical protein